MVQLAVIDPAPLFRRGLRIGLTDAGFDARECSDLIAWAQLQGRRAAVVTVEAPEELDTISLAMAHNRELIVVVLRDESSPRTWAETLKAGAAACIAKSVSFEELIEGLRLALRGKTVAPAEVVRDLVISIPLAPEECPVSDRETIWIKTLATGATVTELARASGYSEREMYRYLSGLYSRMGARNRTEALVRAAHWGLLA